MIKKILLFAIGFVIMNSAFSQQRSHYSQYMLNPYLINPAAGGAEKHHPVRVGYRNQWTNWDGQPRTFYVSGHAHVGREMGQYAGKSRFSKKTHHGVGGALINDVTGPTSRFTGYLSYSYNMSLTEKLRISFGAFAGVQQFKVDGEKLRLRDPSSPLNKGSSHIVPDGSIGTWLYSEKFYAGLSVNQIFQSKLDIQQVDGRYGTGNNKLNNHYFLTGGYFFDLGYKITVIPSAMLKYMNPAPPSFDINTKVVYDNFVWGGISFRNQDAVVGLIGFLIDKRFEVGYSYDYTLSDIRTARSGLGGTHEVMIGYRIGAKQEVMSPSDFW